MLTNRHLPEFIGDFLASWLLVTHITHSIKVAEGKKACGILGYKMKCESCGNSVEADSRTLIQENNPVSFALVLVIASSWPLDVTAHHVWCYTFKDQFSLTITLQDVGF